jgi:hypothetical protein
LGAYYRLPNDFFRIKQMVGWSAMIRIDWITVIVAAQVVSAGASLASAAPCIAPPLSAEAISEFKSNPGAIVPPNTDTRTIEALVRDLAGTDATLAIDLVHLAKAASPRFQTAIAAGLAQAATACASTDQQSALLIEQAVASSDDTQLQESFAAVAGDLSTAATEAAGTAAVGAAGSVVITNPNGSSKSTTNPGAGGTTSLVGITANPFIFANGSRTTSTTITAASPVSPTR